MPRSRLVVALHLAALCTFAIAQPLFEVLANSPEFFVAHRSGRLDLALLAVLLTLGPPALWMLAVLTVDRVSHRAGDVLSAIGIGTFVGAFALLVLKRAFHPAAAIAFGSAAVLALLAVWTYARVASARSFVTVLALGVIGFPAAFFLRPAVAALLSGSPVHSRPVVAPAAPHDVVFVIFDQFPVSSLIDPDTGGIERRAYPAFAALADGSTWFRNATAVNPITGWSVPAIVTGRRPAARELPVAADHPDSLFTLLEPTHRMHVVEPITDLCPARACPPNLEPLPVRMLSMLDDLSLVYLHIVLPDEIATRVPPVTQNWRDFATSRNWLRRWAKQRDEGRRALWSSFVEGVHKEERPVLHYIHILLPHHPFTHLPGGGRYTSDDLPPGLSVRGVWTWSADEWLVTQGYQRHLLQVAFVDRSLGQLLQRLRDTGVYDDALIVVTADHGSRFAPKMSFLNVGPDDFAAIMSVPLFIKRPRQVQGEVDDRNIESIDIVPTIAELLGTRLPWRADGHSLARPDAEGRPRKEFSYDRVTRTRQFEPQEVFSATLAWARRKRDIFGTPDGPFRVPAGAPAAALVGAAVKNLDPARNWPDGRVEIARPWRYAHVDPSGPFVPAAIEGTATWNGGADRQVLAVAVNGVVRATTRTAMRGSSSRAQWMAIVPPSAFAPGPNLVEAFVVEETNPAMHLAHAATADYRTRPDLLDPRVATEFGITLEGFHAPERRPDGRAFRWTSGHARVRVPGSGDLARADALDITIGRTPPGGTDLTIRMAGCTLFTGRIPDRRWSRTFDVHGCATPGRAVTIEFESDTFHPDGRDSRALGVSLERLMLY